MRVSLRLHLHLSRMTKTSLVAAMLLGGCSATPAPKTQAEGSEATPAPRATADSPAGSEGAKAADRFTTTATSAAGLIAAMQARLEVESQHRPGGTPTVETVLAALARGGVACHPGQQSLAGLIEADYCWQSRTVDGTLAFSICEYPSAEAVQKSQQISLTKFPGMGERTFVVAGNTMMTLKVHKPGGEAVIAQVKPIMAALR